MDWASTNHKIKRRSFLFALAGLTCLPFSKEAQAAVGLFDPFSFAYVSDVHLATGLPDSYKMLQQSQLFLQDAVKQLNAEKLDFILFGGDQVEKPGPDDTTWQLFCDIVQGLSCPWTFVLGEQDVAGPPAVDKMRTYGPDWKGKGIETDKPYWSQSPLPGVHLIGLDTSRSGSITGDLSNEQLDWLKGDLAKNARRFTIVLSHHPLLPPPPFDAGPPWDEYVVPQGASAREILGSSKYVRLALSGHVHVTKIQQEGDIWYVSNPSLIVYPCAFRIFKVTPQDITVETYQIQFPALIKKARLMLSTSQIAFKYSQRNPNAFVDVVEGGRLDQDAIMPLKPGAELEAIPPRRKGKKEKGQRNEEQAEPKGKGRRRGKKQEQEPPPQKSEKSEKSERPEKQRTEKQEKQKKEDQQKSAPQSQPPEKQKPQAGDQDQGGAPTRTKGEPTPETDLSPEKKVPAAPDQADQTDKPMPQPNPTPSKDDQPKLEEKSD